MLTSPPFGLFMGWFLFTTIQSVHPPRKTPHPPTLTQRLWYGHDPSNSKEYAKDRPIPGIPQAAPRQRFASQGTRNMCSMCVCVVSAKSGKKNNSAEQEISLGSRQKCRSPRWTGSWGQIHPSRKLRNTAPIQTTPRFFRSFCLPVPRPSSRFFSPKEEQPPKKGKKNEPWESKATEGFICARSKPCRDACLNPCVHDHPSYSRFRTEKPV